MYVPNLTPLCFQQLYIPNQQDADKLSLHKLMVKVTKSRPSGDIGGTRQEGSYSYVSFSVVSLFCLP